MIANMKLEQTLRKLSMKGLDAKGLGRWDEEYYLVGLYHPLRSMKCAGHESLKLDEFFGTGPNCAEVDVYIHVPFCHINCSFCHFYKEIIPRNSENSLEQIYVAALLQEIENYTARMGQPPRPTSIQFGGGTPSALSVTGLSHLLAGLEQRFDMSACAEVKFEFHPDMANDLDGYRARLRALKAFGLTTAIIDLEATDGKVLKAISRGNTSTDGYLRLIEIAKEEGIASVASAFMTGLPNETPETFAETLSFLSGIRNLDAINVYPLMFKPSDAVFQQRRRNPHLFAGPNEKDLMMVMAHEILGQNGFIESPSHFFTRGNHDPRQQIAKARSRSLLGLGPASFGYLNGEEGGIQYMNYPDLNRYVTAVTGGLTGVWRGAKLNTAQKALRQLIFALNSFDWVPADLVPIAACANTRLHQVIDALLAANLLETVRGKLRLTPRGQMRNSEVIFYLAEPEVVIWDRDDPEYSDIRRYEFFPDVSRDNQVLFERYLAQNQQRLAV